MKTGKRLLAIILTLVLCLGMLPTTVFAASLKTSSSSGIYYYTFKNVGTGKYLNVKGNSSANNANITLWQKDGTSGQNFALYYDSANKGYVIVPECSTSRAVNIYGSSAGAGKNVCTWTKTGHSTQAWILKSVSGGYVIQSANNKDYVLTASGSSNGSNICIQKYSSTNKKQVWALTLSKSDEDSVSIGVSSAPSSITKGSSYSISGTVTSKFSNIMTIDVYVTNSSGATTCYIPRVVGVNSKSYSLSKLSLSSTNKLSAGTYNLKIVAKNYNGKSATKTISFTVNNTSTSTVDVNQIKNKMTSTYSRALELAHMGNFQGYCGKCVGYQLQALGITLGYENGHGNVRYDNYANAKKSSGGYNITSTSASSKSLNAVLNSYNNSVSCTKNQYLMLGFQTGSNGNANGHALIIYGIVNSTVYYTDSFSYNGMQASCSSMTITNFCNYYGNNGYTYEGAILFSK